MLLSPGKGEGRTLLDQTENSVLILSFIFQYGFFCVFLFCFPCVCVCFFIRTVISNVSEVRTLRQVAEAQCSAKGSSPTNAVYK